MYYYKEGLSVFKSKYRIDDLETEMITEEEYRKEMTKLREVTRKENDPPESK